MEVPQGDSLCSYLKQAKIWFLLFLSFAKSENRGAKQALPGGVYTGGRGEVGEEGKRVNVVQILCTHDVNGKKIPIETVSWMGREEGKGNGGYLIYCKNLYK
jgi:hypothetical protein